MQFTIKYTLLFGDTLGLFVYGGIENHLVWATGTGADDNIRVSLASQQPCGGLGLLFHLVPSWDVRVDAGIEGFGGGLAVRF